MRFGYSEVCLAHDTGSRHPEGPDRLRAIRTRLAKRHGVDYHEPAPATNAELTAVHSEDYIDSLRSFCADGGGRWDPDTVAVEATWDAAVQSAGLARWVATDAQNTRSARDTPFALGRPPGHHALRDDAMGFCFVNNVAVGAQAAIDADAVERVAIFDWDVHHGNGTQEIFYDRGDVFYASIHEDGIYPGTGAIEDTGRTAGDGATVNIPLSAGAGDPEYLAAMDDIVVPAITRFGPDLLLISAGFDAHRHDPISRMRVTTEGFGGLAIRVRRLADAVGASLGFVLEGGYSLDMLADGVAMVHEVFDGHQPVDTEDAPTQAVVDRLERIAAVHGLGSK